MLSPANNVKLHIDPPFSSSPRWLHCVPVMWNGIPTGGLQESGLLHWEHWNRCCHELDHEPHGWPRCARWWESIIKRILNLVTQSLCCLLSDWLQTSQPPWCCPAAALVLGPHPQRASLRSTWQPLYPWASAETRQPKHFEPRLESDSVQIRDFTYLSCIEVELCMYRCCSHVFTMLGDSNQCCA